MKAKEMFEALGYKLKENNNGYIYFRELTMGDKIIPSGYLDFDFRSKTLCCDSYIDCNEFKAIHQQLKELGWLDETL